MSSGKAMAQKSSNDRVKQSSSHLGLMLLITGWYSGNALYNIFNKKATIMIDAHWSVAAAQLLVGIFMSLASWVLGIRKLPNLSREDIVACIPPGFCIAIAHAGSVRAMGAGAVSFAQTVKASEPVFAAVLGMIVPPYEVKSSTA
eukprot:CAMPEP_0196822880 /NCGR_PEP_ID=MMETSP1362-20130617/85142_1 /TAXON_ID=163516 /ORGANISM="Leptocylindrus danicus, Strain CCMP1856" /LENGTH=144 /DNA_ID=CAMNT_0042202561 /DNA_START=32 /DNA_END=463 /DNA_ORIENTATION=+